MKLIPLLLTSGLLTVGSLVSSVGRAAAADCNAAGFAFTSCIGSFELGKGQNDVTDGGADNLASQKLASGVFDGITDWLFNSKINVGGGETGSDALGFNLSYNSGATTGQFTFGNIDLATTNLAISMKSANSYSLFFFEAGSLLSSTFNWDMFGVSTNKRGIAQGLSHASVYYSKLPTPVISPVTPPPVPPSETPKTETPKTEVPVVSEPAPAPAPAPEAPKAEEPKVETPVVFEPAPAPAPEAPKTEEPKVETPVVSEPAPAPQTPKIEIPTEVLTAEPPVSQPVTEVPEPASLLGLAAVVGLGTQLKRKLASN